jgi:anthranilate synthase/indole-3-glycerol phosphate synthase/phosphoribosylanthranilate isomerase
MSSSSSILDTIATQRKVDVLESKEKINVEKLIEMMNAINVELGHPLNLYDVVIRGSVGNSLISLAAEFKRASPSKGDIALDLNVSEQMIRYANAGASVVSVLTEPKWFKGSLNDMKMAREAVSSVAASPSSRVAVLRKDFIVDEYQLYEARAYGADTVLLIVAILDDALLTKLISKSRELGMEPLVEVNSTHELTRALACNALVIGVNNRNLHTFHVDLKTTENVMDEIKRKDLKNIDNKKPIVIALSGIKSREDVIRYEKNGVRGVLVGEALMRSNDPGLMVSTLIGTTIHKTTLVKICGVRSVEDALMAAKHGADLVGMIFVAKSKRCVSINTAKEIVSELRKFREEPTDERIQWEEVEPTVMNDEVNDDGVQNKRSSRWYRQWSEQLEKNIKRKPPLVVGVFMNQPVNEILHVVQETNIDIVQFHGNEGFDVCNMTKMNNTPCIRVIHVNAKSEQEKEGKKESIDDTTASASATTNTTTPSSPPSLMSLLGCDIPLNGPPSALLVDTKIKGQNQSGGTGLSFDWTIANKVHDHGYPLIVAGGLNPNNVSNAILQTNAWCVDVSSGVENIDTGYKDHEKVIRFIKNAKSAYYTNNGSTDSTNATTTDYSTDTCNDGVNDEYRQTMVNARGMTPQQNYDLGKEKRRKEHELRNQKTKKLKEEFSKRQGGRPQFAPRFKNRNNPKPLPKQESTCTLM